jgi:hypothetical protein
MKRVILKRTTPQAYMFSELVERAVLCTPFGSTGNGAHGVTRPTCAVRARPKGKTVTG